MPHSLLPPSRSRHAALLSAACVLVGAKTFLQPLQFCLQPGECRTVKVHIYPAYEHWKRDADDTLRLNTRLRFLDWQRGFAFKSHLWIERAARGYFHPHFAGPEYRRDSPP